MNVIINKIVLIKENARLLNASGSEVRPPSNHAQRNRTRAINIDRFSRVFFPLLFAVLNGAYWFMFAEFL